MKDTKGEYIISTDKTLLDCEAVYHMLSVTYWGNHRTIDIVRRSIETSICYGVYLDQDQVGFARIVTDGATMYWLCDVVIDERHRGQGIGKKLIDTIVHSEPFRHLTGFLGTADAHGLYEQYGFEKEANRFMLRRPK